MTATVSVLRYRTRPAKPLPPVPDCDLCRLPRPRSTVTLGPAAGAQFGGHQAVMTVSEAHPALVAHHAYLRGSVDGRVVEEYVALHGVVIEPAGEQL